MPCLITEPKQELALAPGLLSIIDAAETAGWSIKRGGSFVELAKPASGPYKPTAYTINSKRSPGLGVDRQQVVSRDGVDAHRAARPAIPGIIRLLHLAGR